MRNKVFIAIGLVVTTYYIGAIYEKQNCRKNP